MGTEEFWVPAVVGALGAGANAVNQNNAAKRSSNAQTTAIIDQEQKQQQANSAVNKVTQQIATSNPAQLKAQATGDFVNTLRKNMAGSSTSNPNSALAPVAGGGARYNADKATGQANTEQFGNSLADELGTITAAPQQRINEGTAMNTLGVNLNGINAASQSQAFVDQLRAQLAGQPNPYVGMAGNLLQTGANAYAKNVGNYDPELENPDGTLKLLKNTSAVKMGS